ncbi:aminotransferase class V-fold PLP-dependent enzyme [Ekhidna sp.]|uniref:aminotransferase class V-fold PLP-dependent enzyme n=1 Tax=Ekhidna sp. TaxID=2608089 RepID=UPI003C79FF25
MTERKSLNPEQIKQDILNYLNKIFLNSAGSSLPPKSVHEKVKEYLDLEEKVGGYKAAEIKQDSISEFYHNAADLLACQPSNIAFTHNATDAFSKALTCIDFQPNDVIITTDCDYNSNYIQFFSLVKRNDIKIVRINSLENGDLDLEDFQEKVEKYMPKLVSVSHIPTNSGMVQDVHSIGEICSKNEIRYLVDACQSVGQLEVNVNEIKCDFLSTTGRKFLRGPRGTGFLYVSDRVLDDEIYPLMLDGAGAIWDQENDFTLLEGAKRFEMWEKPYALLVGLSEAIRYLNEVGSIPIEAYNKELMRRFRNNLRAIPNVEMFDMGTNLSSILTFRKNGKSLEEIEKRLNDREVYYSVSNKESGYLDFTNKGIDWAIRLSPHYFNSIDEIDRVSEIIESI